MAQPSFDIVSEIDLQEVRNAVDQASREIHQRFDFKNTDTQLTLEGETVKDAEKRFTADEDGFVEIVFSVDNGVVAARQVKTGIQSDDKIEIVSGVAADEVVVTGSYRAISTDLRNGAHVRIKANDDDA